MSGFEATAYAVYVEKELVGKRIKSSKVRVMWQLAFSSDFSVHQIELKHSIVTGKREIRLDSQTLFQSQHFFQGTFEHPFTVSGHSLRVTVEDTFDGFLYDLLVDGIQFHRLPRKSLAELEVLRKGKAEVKMSFKDFTSSSNSALDGGASSQVVRTSKPPAAAGDLSSDSEDEEERRKRKEEKKKKKAAAAAAAAAGQKQPELDLLSSFDVPPALGSGAAQATNPWDDPWGTPAAPATAPRPVSSQPPQFSAFASSSTTTASAADPFNPFAPTSSNPYQMPAATNNFGFQDFSSNPFQTSQPTAPAAPAPTRTIPDVSSLYGQQPPPMQKAASSDPFSSDLYNLSNLNAPPPAAQQHIDPFASMTRTVPIASLPVQQQTQNRTSQQPPMQQQQQSWGAPQQQQFNYPLPQQQQQQQQQQQPFGYPQPSGGAPPPGIYAQPQQTQQPQQQGGFVNPFMQPQQQNLNPFNPYG